jgi:hypothetical protein
VPKRAWLTADVVGLYREAIAAMSGEPNLCLDIRGNIVLKHLMDTSFRLLNIFGIFHTFYCSSVERVSLFEQLLETPGIRAVNVR